MIDEYKAAGVSPRRVFPQSFDKNDVLYWIDHEPAFGRQAVYLDDANGSADLPGFAELVGYKQAGHQYRRRRRLFALLALDAGNHIVPSQYARNAKAAGLDIITWTLERSGILADGNNGFYYQTIRLGHQARRRRDEGARRPRQGRRHPRHLLGLGRDRDLLRQLHGAEVGRALIVLEASARRGAAGRRDAQRRKGCLVCL